MKRKVNLYKNVWNGYKMAEQFVESVICNHEDIDKVSTSLFIKHDIFCNEGKCRITDMEFHVLTWIPCQRNKGIMSMPDGINN